MTFQRYVALGDSFTEGVGDPAPDLPNGVRGWADRFAADLASRDPDVTYANLAIRGRKLGPILAEQLEPAIALQPDLVTLHGGGNDLLRPRFDVDAMSEAYDAAVGRLTAAGAHVVLFTLFDSGPGGLYGPFRGRWALWSEQVRWIADRHGATIVDYWRMHEYRDARMWDADRLHMSPAGHQHMAIAVANALGIDHALEPLPLVDPPAMTQWRWVREHGGPWVKRRLTGTSSGDGLSPRWPALVRPAARS